MNETLSFEAEPFEAEPFEAEPFEAEPFKFETGAEEFGQEEADHQFESFPAEETFEAIQSETGAAAARSIPGAAITGQQRAKVLQALERRRATHARFVQALGALDKYIVKRGGTYRFTLPARTITEVASKLGLDPKITTIFLKSLKRKNARLRAARVTQAELDLEAPTCAGRSDKETFWWGTKFWVNECDTISIIKALQVAGAAGGGCAALVPEGHVKLACGVLGAVSGVTSAGIEAIDSAGGYQGIIIYNPFVGPAWVWHQ